METLSSYIEGLEFEYNSCKLSDNPEVVEKLKQFEEFKNVERINILEMPIFKLNMDTGEPFTFDNDDNLGSEIRTECINTVKIGGDIELNNIIDLYSIELTPPVYDVKRLSEPKIGIEKHPTSYNDSDFSSFDYITVGYSLTNIMDAEGLTLDEAKAVVKERIIRKISVLIDSDKTTFKNTRQVMLRCSSRSIKQKEN